MAIEDILTEAIMLADSEKMKLMIYNNMSLCLEPSAKKMIFMARNFMLSKEMKEELRNLNSKKVEKIIKEKRPDLFDVLTHYPGGFNWLQRQISEIKETFL